MIGVTDLSQALVNAVKGGSDILKTVDVHEPEYDVKEIGALLPLAPFCLISCIQNSPVEKLQNGEALQHKQVFHFLVGAKSLIKKTVAGESVQAILDYLRELLDGQPMVVNAVETPTFSWIEPGDQFEWSAGGLVVYSTQFEIYQI